MSGMFRAGDEIMAVDGVELNGKTLLESKRLFLGLEGTMVQLRCACMAVSKCEHVLMRGCDMLIVLVFLPLRQNSQLCLLDTHVVHAHGHMAVFVFTVQQYSGADLSCISATPLI